MIGVGSHNDTRYFLILIRRNYFRKAISSRSVQKHFLKWWVENLNQTKAVGFKVWKMIVQNDQVCLTTNISFKNIFSWNLLLTDKLFAEEAGVSQKISIDA